MPQRPITARDPPTGPLTTLWRIIGPALLFSGAAVGTSHLVQSTRAGAMHGLALVSVILLANLLKYPAFRFGVDYGHATRRSILSGYREIGMWAPVLLVLVTFPIYPVITAAICAATAGIAISVGGLNLSVPLVATLLLVAVGGLLIGGGYDWLDRINRVLLAFLLVSTLATTAMVLPRVEWATLVDTSWATDPKAILFIVALAGFMPNPLDVSITQSMWTAAAEDRLGEGHASSLADTRRAFLVGYVMTALLAVCFCIMGAGVMHAGQITPETSAPAFAAQVIGLYSAALGEGAAALAAVAALSVMLTTVLAAVDIEARNAASAFAEISGRRSEATFTRVYRIAIPVLVAATTAVLFTLLADFAAFLDLATSATFVAAPLIATLNHVVVSRGAIDEAARPSAAIRTLNLIGIATMVTLSVAYFML